MNRLFLLAFTITAFLFQLSACQGQDSVKTLFEFDGNSAKQWQIVNDGVMGGLSTSKASMTKDEKMLYTGTLSLENNGGFASVRSKPKQLNLQTDDSILLRVKGDGRTYTFNLYVPTRRMAFSYQQEFKTKAGEWVNVKLPLNKFQAKSFGRKVDFPLTPRSVNSVGILLGDKKPGSFEILLDKIQVQRAR